MIDKKALLVSILITLLLMGYVFISGIRVEKVSYRVEVTPWWGSYTPTVRMPYLDSGELFQINL